jgi:hypothetical protein
MRVDADDEGFSSLYAVFPGVNPDTPRAGFGPLGEERTGPLGRLPVRPEGRGSAPQLPPPLSSILRYTAHTARP